MPDQIKNPGIVVNNAWQRAEIALQARIGKRNDPYHSLSMMSQQEGVSERRLYLLSKVAEFFPENERFEDLSFSHHLEAMRLDPHHAKYWLKKARKFGWKSRQVRLAIMGNGDPEKYSWLRFGTYWYFSKCDPRFGIEYPGRIPGQIAANAIYYFTERGDLVVDPMAGGGSTLDAAVFLGRRALGYDLSPSRKDIKRNDALQGIPRETEGTKLFFIDPPYGEIAKGFYQHESCVSELGESQFMEAMLKIARLCSAKLMSGGYLAIVMQNVRDWLGDTVFELTGMLIKDGWRLVQRIQVPISSQQVSSSVMRWAKENRRLVNLDRDLLIFQRVSG